MENTDKKDQPECRTYTVEEIAAMLGIGRTTAYQLVREHHFRSIRIGFVVDECFSRMRIGLQNLFLTFHEMTIQG